MLSAGPPPPWTDDPTEACNRPQEPFPDELGEPDHHEPQLEAWLRGEDHQLLPPVDQARQFEEAAGRVTRRDLATVVQDLANEGKRPAQIARMFGLKPVEVRQMLSAKP